MYDCIHRIHYYFLDKDELLHNYTVQICILQSLIITFFFNTINGIYFNIFNPNDITVDIQNKGVLNKNINVS